jgi:DNA-binding MarR family transcriptional regulator
MMEAPSLRTIGLLFRSIHSSFRQEMERSLRKGGFGLTFAEVSILLALQLYPGSNGAQLARRDMVSAQALTGVLRKLLAKKYIERQPHPESLRADSWHLSEKGRALMERAKPVYEAATSRMLSGLQSREIADLEKYLRLCARSLETTDAED